MIQDDHPTSVSGGFRPALATRGRGRYRPAILAAIAGVSVTAVAVAGAAWFDGGRRRAEFELLAEARVRSIEYSLELDLDALRAVSALFDASEHVTREEFRLFVRPLLRRKRGLAAIGWIPRVPAEDRAVYERAARAEGYEDFVIWEEHEDGRTPVDERPEYFPFYFLHPETAEVLGFDLASDQTRYDAIKLAAGGRMSVTGRVNLVGGDAVRPGVLAILGRRDGGGGFEGCFVGVINLRDLLDTAIGAAPGVDLALSDESSDPAERELVTRRSREVGWSTAGAAVAPVAPSDLCSETVLMVGDRRWTVMCTPSAGYIGTRALLLPFGMLGGGLVVTTLATLYVLLLSRHTESLHGMNQRLARQIDDRRWAEDRLRESEERYRTLVEHAPEAIVVVDVESGRFVDMNRNAEALFGRSRAELLELEPAELSPETQSDGRRSVDLVRMRLAATLAGETPVFEWTHLDGDGRSVPCEVRLVRLHATRRRLVRGSITDISERKRAQARMTTMMRELDHRVKNNLAAVLALSQQTVASSRSLEEFGPRFVGRILAMARTHEALASKRWGGLDLAAAIRLTLEPFVHDGRRQLRLEGAETILPSLVVAPLGLVLHELATNATKYGALSTADGSVEVTWTESASDPIRVTWIERGGPPVAQPPNGAGLGLQLVQGLVEREIGGRVAIRFEPDGLICEMRLPHRDP